MVRGGSRRRGHSAGPLLMFFGLQHTAGLHNYHATCGSRHGVSEICGQNKTLFNAREGFGLSAPHFSTGKTGTVLGGGLSHALYAQFSTGWSQEFSMKFKRT